MIHDQHIDFYLRLMFTCEPPLNFRATIIGFAYGATTLVSSSIIVPMAAHSLNNLVGGILWNYSSKSHDSKSSQ